MSTQATPGQAGWFPDPVGRFDSRYWDGATWTEAVMRAGNVDTDPVAVAPSTAVGSDQSDTPTITPELGPPPSPTDRMTSLSPQDTQARVTHMLAMSEIAIRNSAPGRIDAEIEFKPEPNWILVVVLLCIWIVPGVIYWYVKTRPVRNPLTLVFVQAPTGTRIAIQAPPPAMEKLAPVLAPLPW
jgi:hypothetical protein